MFKTFEHALVLKQLDFESSVGVFNNVFDDDKVEEIVNYALTHEVMPAALGTGDVWMSLSIRDAYQVNCGSEEYKPLKEHIFKGFYECLHKYVQTKRYARDICTENLVADGECGLVLYRPNSRGYKPHLDGMIDTYRVASRLFSIIGYFNDDFSGGELYFPDLNKTLKIKRNSCVVFPSAFLFTHAALSLGKGYKVICPAWFGYKVPTGLDGRDIV